jgi:hypothetical protein
MGCIEHALSVGQASAMGVEHEQQAVCMLILLMLLTIDCCQLELRAILGKAHALHLAALHSLDELGIAPLVALWQA